MILLVIVSVKTLERIPFLKTFPTEEKVVTVLTHVTVFYNLDLTCKTFVFFLLIYLWLKYHLHLVIGLMVPRCRFGLWPLEVTLLAFYIINSYIACNCDSMHS